MYLDEDGQLVLSPSDLTGFAECRHLTNLDRLVAGGRLAPPVAESAKLALLTGRGEEHESAYLDRLVAGGRDVVRIDDPPRAATADRVVDRRRLAAAAAETVAAMRAGVEVIYQATFCHDGWRGHADFLIKRPDRPSSLGGWSYDVTDTKLARRLKVTALLQMASYGEHLARLQGRPPEWLTVVTGTGDEESFRYLDVASYYRRLAADLRRTVAEPTDTYPQPVPHCDVCRWAAECAARRRADDHLSLVAYLRRDQTRLLNEAGIWTVRQLADSPEAGLPTSIGPVPRHRLWLQARLQIQERDTGAPRYALLPADPGRGLALLPTPDPGDLFFDIEGDPFLADGFQYLFGWVDTRGRFHSEWADDEAGEKRAFQRVVDRFLTAWSTHPGMHIYHYASYEPSWLKRLVDRHRTREDELDRLLRGERFVDLYTVLRQGLRISRESYSIKEVEAFYRPGARAGQVVADGMDSVLVYERWLQEADERLRADILSYNEQDCLSTRELRDWLEQRRSELVAAGVAVDRPTHGDGAPSEVAEQVSAEVAELQRRLRLGQPAEALPADPDGRARWLLADLLGWHRREQKPEWWEYFARLQRTDEQLVDDPAAVGLLAAPTWHAAQKQSTVWRHQFPAQDTRIGPGDKWLDPRTRQQAGTVVGVDPVAGCLLLRRASNSTKPHPTALVPPGPLDDRVLRASLRDLAGWVVDHGLSGPGGWRAGRDLLLGRPPRLAAAPAVPGARRRPPLVRPGESATAAVRRLGARLAGGVLAVQGPPGSGKTWAGAALAVDLLAAGRRVGVCAFSHKAIGNLLEEICRQGTRRQVEFAALQKAAEGEGCASSRVECTNDTAEVIARVQQGAVDLLAGTVWLFAQEELRSAVDVLIVDEAGQLALANALAASRAGRSLVLLGDPQQLAQPVKGVHPPAAAASALGHLLGDSATVPPDRGVFLDRTRRMHPAVCRFVSDVSYEGRLLAESWCARQQVRAPGALTGVGLRWVPVEHEDNSAASTEEALVVARLYAELRHGRWTDAGGVDRPLTADDVLVIAPYNAQVARLTEHLPPGARVGTVDRFQGQEGVVVLYSLATSSAADAPRDLSFLFSLNRLTVAVSRARALSVIVGSPRLLDSPVRTPEQLRLVNALCRYAELADTVTAHRRAGRPAVR